MEPQKNTTLCKHGTSDSNIRIKSNWSVEIHQVFPLGITQLMEYMRFILRISLMKGIHTSGKHWRFSLEMLSSL